MAPEYRIYIPAEAQAEFEGFTRQIKGSRTWKMNSSRDLVLVENAEDITLAQSVRNVIDTLPKSTKLKDLRRPNEPMLYTRQNQRNIPHEWADFIKNLPPIEKKTVVSRIGRLFLNLTVSGRQDDDITLEDLREINWGNEEKIRQITGGRIPTAIRFGRRIFGEIQGLSSDETIRNEMENKPLESPHPPLDGDSIPSQKANRKLDELIGVFRKMFAEIPKNTKFRELYSSDQWTIFTDTFTVAERIQITSAFRPVWTSGYASLTLEELSQIDWDQFKRDEYIPSFGPKRKNFVRKTLESLTFSDNQDNLIKNPS